MTNYFEVDKVITCAGTAPIASTAVDIYAIKVGKDPLLMKRQLAVTAGAWTTTMTVPSSYVSPFGEVYLKVVDSYNPTIAGTKFYTIDPTLTIDTPTLTEGVEGSITGTSNYVGQHIEVEVRLSGETPEDAWTPFGTATVAGDGSWTVSGTIASADTYDFRVIDENIDPAVCSAQVDDVEIIASYIGDSYMIVADYNNKRSKKHSLDDLSYIAKDATFDGNACVSVLSTKDSIYISSGSNRLERTNKSFTHIEWTSVLYLTLCTNETNIYRASYASVQGLNLEIRRYPMTSLAAWSSNEILIYWGDLFPNQITNVYSIRHKSGLLYVVGWLTSPTRQILRRMTIAGASVTDLISVNSTDHFIDVCIDKDDYIYIARDTGIYKYNSAGVYQNISYTPGQVRSCESAGEYIYIAVSDNTIRKLNRSDLSHVATYGSTGSGDDQFNDIRRISIYNGH